jgi:hypothetical protein
VTSLGADEGKIVLTATAFANKFTLLDSERNLPGAAAVGKPETITYQQVSAQIGHNLDELIGSLEMTSQNI